MDPNATLKELRTALAAVDFQTQEHTGYVDLDDAVTVVTLFKELDHWLTRGGFPPEEWGSL